MTRRARLLPVPQVPDLTARIVAAVQAERLEPPARTGGFRTQFDLVAVASFQPALAMLLGGEDGEASMHVAHEMGSVNVALAAAYLITGWQPYRAGGLLPFAGVAAALLAVTAGMDLPGGETGAGRRAAAWPGDRRISSAVPAAESLTS